jgi:hypothetical protein
MGFSAADVLMIRQHLKQDAVIVELVYVGLVREVLLMEVP